MAEQPPKPALSKCEHLKRQLNTNAKNVVRCTKVSTLFSSKKKDENCGNFIDELLKLACAALNTPGEDNDAAAQDRWCLLIHLEDAVDNVDYIGALSERIDRKLIDLLPGFSDFSRHFEKKLLKDDKMTFLQLFVTPCGASIAIKDPNTSLAMDSGLLEATRVDMATICDYVYSPKSTSSEGLLKTPSGIQRKKKGEILDMCEHANLQFKGIQKGNTTKGDKGVFKGNSPEDYIEWVWKGSNRTLGQYVSAFAKQEMGGIYYCGVQELTQNQRKTYLVNGLELQKKWLHDIQRDLEDKIKENMLWLMSTPTQKKGFEEICPRSGTHFSIAFIPVKSAEPSSSSTSSGGKPSSEMEYYILEVKVAPFHGIVFHHKRGLMAYYMKRTQDSNESLTWEPEEISRETWEAEMVKNSWCTEHTTRKDLNCLQCIRVAERRSSQDTGH